MSTIVGGPAAISRDFDDSEAVELLDNIVLAMRRTSPRTALAVGPAPAPLPCNHSGPSRSPFNSTAFKTPLTLAIGTLTGTNAGVYAATDSFGTGTRDREKFDGEPQRARITKVFCADRSDSFPMDRVGVSRSAKSQSGEDRKFVNSIMSVDIGSGIRFGITEVLGFRQRVFERCTRLLHRGEDVVSRTVDNRSNALDAICAKAVLDNRQDRDTTTNARFVRDAYAVDIGQAEQFVAMFGQSLFVGRDYMLSSVKSRGHVGTRRLFTAHDLNYDIRSIVAQHLFRICRQQVLRNTFTLSCNVAHQYAVERQRRGGVGIRIQYDACDLRSDDTSAQKPDAGTSWGV